jgi:hypothetical protein
MNLIEFSNMIATSNIQSAPAHIIVHGKTGTDKKLSVVENAGLAARMYLSTKAGKLGKYAREGMAVGGEAMIIGHAIRADYRALAEALAGITGESVIISNRATFQAMPDVYAAKLADLRNGGMVEDKKNPGLLKPSAKRKAYVEAAELCIRVITKVAEHFEAKKAESEAEQLELAE